MPRGTWIFKILLKIAISDPMTNMYSTLGSNYANKFTIETKRKETEEPKLELRAENFPLKYKAIEKEKNEN